MVFKCFVACLLYFLVMISIFFLFVSKLRRETQRASFYSHLGIQTNIITREILILAMWFIELKVILLRCRTDIRDEPARPEPARSGHDAFDGLFLKFIKRYELETFT